MHRLEGIFTNRRLLALAGFLMAAFVTGATTSTAVAQVTDFTIFRSGEYEQTGATTVGSLYYYFASTADTNPASGYTGASLVTPTDVFGMSGPDANGNFSYSSPQFPSSTVLNDNYPAGTYTLEATNPSTTFSVDLTYDGTDNYAPPPTLTPASYDGLAGLNPSAGYTFSFGAFTPPEGTLGIIFITLTNLTTNTVVYSNATEDLTTTSFYVPGSDLAPGDSYVEELVFSTRDEVTDPPCTGPTGQCPALGEIGWDSRTEVFFTTSVPEPSTWAMVLVGFGGLGYAAFRRRSRSGALTLGI
jgi:PEP-CTERM motif